MSIRHGQFCWYELMTTDAAAATAFYSHVVGWVPKDAGHASMAYTLLTVDDVAAAGLMALPEEACAAGARPGWMGHVAADDVDATAAAVKQAGGSIRREPTDIPGVGRFALAADPQGAAFYLFHGVDAPPAGPPGSGQADFVGWRELHAVDWETAFGFYAGLFGWTKAQAVDMGPIGTYQIFAAGADQAGGMMTKMAAMPLPAWSYYFNVEEIGAAATRVKDKGGTVLNGPHQVPGGSWIVNCLDPQGATFSLVAMRP